MIMALIASLLMRLRCFLRRRGEAGRNGERRDDGLGAAVGRAERHIQCQLDDINKCILKDNCFWWLQPRKQIIF